MNLLLLLLKSKKKMKKLLIILTSVLVLIGCSAEEKKVIVRTESRTISPIDPTKDVVPSAILTVKIDGMTCVMGCGSSIRKELYATKGVKSVNFDFKEGRKTTTATITFDSIKIDDKKMIQLLTTINEKQFTVGETSISKIKK